MHIHPFNRSATARSQDLRHDGVKAPPLIQFVCVGRMRHVAFLLLALLLLAPLFLAPLAKGQTFKKEYGIGVLVGPISGLGIKARLSNRDELPQLGPKQSLDVNLSSNFDDYALLSAHVLSERRLPESPLTGYLGPGLTGGLEGKRLFWGLSSEIGILFQKGPYEVFLQGMPRLYIVPEFDGRIEAATGIRVFF